MKIRTLIYSFLLCITNIGLADSEQSQLDLSGIWFSERVEDGKTIKLLSKRLKNNKYGLLFIICEGNKIAWMQKELGDWSYENGIYQTITRQIEDPNGMRQPDTSSKTYVENYIDVTVSDGILTYRHQVKNKYYKQQKVVDGYRINCQ